MRLDLRTYGGVTVHMVRFVYHNQRVRKVRRFEVNRPQTHATASSDCPQHSVEWLAQEMQSLKGQPTLRILDTLANPTRCKIRQCQTPRNEKHNARGTTQHVQHMVKGHEGLSSTSWRFQVNVTSYVAFLKFFALVRGEIVKPQHALLVFLRKICAVGNETERCVLAKFFGHGEVEFSGQDIVAETKHRLHAGLRTYDQH
mmetsp:Transcript_58772/g.156380  ORF Transcript_58772/g.156380 Transcript_58772/m.156380 type:complete len:200 (-) Transcript_58772:224-823(-)